MLRAEPRFSKSGADPLSLALITVKNVTLRCLGLAAFPIMERPPFPASDPGDHTSPSIKLLDWIVWTIGFATYRILSFVAAG